MKLDSNILSNFLGDIVTQILDEVQNILVQDPSDSRDVLRNVFRLLRAQLLSNNNLKVMVS